MDNILDISTRNIQQAWNIIEDSNIINIWQSIGASINLIGSVKTGLLMKHRDIDFHIYSSPLTINESFYAISKLAENPSVKHIEYSNLIETDERCIEWHAFYTDKYNDIWQIDMIHIEKGSLYDGYMEKVAERLNQILTTELKHTILKLKYDTPDTEKIAGIEYYVAVIRDHIKNYPEFAEWRKNNPVSGIVDWMP
jgi:hypothetical protein